jgi:predicted HNH restriction endonuclease
MCANCHAMLHRARQVLTVAQLLALLRVQPADF